MSSPAPATPRRGLLPEMTVALWTVLVAIFVILGADLLWVVALGDTIRSTGAVPAGIPFAVAEQPGWHNPIVLAQVLLSVVHGWGGAGLAALQLVIVASTLSILVADGRRLGGSDLAIAGVVSLVVVGSAGAFVITRLPSLSLIPFALAVSVMRRQHESSDGRIWLLIPLYVLWGNIHGGVLVGLAVLAVFLIASPAGGPVVRRIGLCAGCASAVVLTPALVDTPAYYASALGNEAAARGSDLWARPDPSNALDVAMALVVVVLLVRAVRRRPPLWEWVASAGLLIGTVAAARNGVWLVLFLAPAAMRPRPREGPGAPSHAGPPTTRARLTLLTVTTVVAGVLLAARGPTVGPPGADAVDAVRKVAAGRPVLADEPLAETLAQEGISVWASNPIDAFPREVQAQFLDFLRDGRPPGDAGGVDVAAVNSDLAPGLTVSGDWREVTRVGEIVVLERVR